MYNGNSILLIPSLVNNKTGDIAIKRGFYDILINIEIRAYIPNKKQPVSLGIYPINFIIHGGSCKYQIMYTSYNGSDILSLSKDLFKLAKVQFNNSIYYNKDFKFLFCRKSVIFSSTKSLDLGDLITINLYSMENIISSVHNYYTNTPVNDYNKPSLYKLSDISLYLDSNFMSLLGTDNILTDKMLDTRGVLDYLSQVCKSNGYKIVNCTDLAFDD